MVVDVVGLWGRVLGCRSVHCCCSNGLSLHTSPLMASGATAEGIIRSPRTDWITALESVNGSSSTSTRSMPTCKKKKKERWVRGRSKKAGNVFICLRNSASWRGGNAETPVHTYNTTTYPVPLSEHNSATEVLAEYLKVDWTFLRCSFKIVKTGMRSNSDWHSFHLCHDKLGNCAEETHVIREPAHINNDRKVCAYKLRLNLPL